MNHEIKHLQLENVVFNLEKQLAKIEKGLNEPLIELAFWNAIEGIFLDYQILQPDDAFDTMVRLNKSEMVCLVSQTIKNNQFFITVRVYEGNTQNYVSLKVSR